MHSPYQIYEGKLDDEHVLERVGLVEVVGERVESRGAQRRKLINATELRHKYQNEHQ